MMVLGSLIASGLQYDFPQYLQYLLYRVKILDPALKEMYFRIWSN